MTAATIRHPLLKELLNYYRARQEPGKLLGRLRLEPADIPEILPHLILVSVEQGSLKVRLAGTRVVDRFGFELTGKNLLDFLPPDLSQKYETLFMEVLGKRFAALAGFELPRRGLLPLDIEMILLPMSDREGEENLVMVGIGYVSDEVRHESIEGNLAAPGVKSFSGIDLGFGLPGWVGEVRDGDWMLAIRNSKGKGGGEAE